MKQLAFMPPTQEQYRQAVISSFLSSGNLKILGVVFLVSLAALYLLKFLKSLLVKVLIAILITAIVAIYLYFKVTTGIRF